MGDELFLGLLATGLILFLCYEPTRIFLFWVALIAGAIALAMAVGPLWFIAILLVLILLN